jgi:hypothetical protein
MTTATILAASSESNPPVAGAGLPACPFCASDKCMVAHDTSSDHRYDWDYRVECTSCGACGASDKSEAEAIASWSSRTTSPVSAGDETEETRKKIAGLEWDLSEAERAVQFWKGKATLAAAPGKAIGAESVPAEETKDAPFAWAVRGTILQREQWSLCLASDPGDVDYVNKARAYRYDGKSVHEIIELFSAPPINAAPANVVEIAARIFDFKLHKQTEESKTKWRLFASEVRATNSPDAALSRAVYKLIQGYQSGIYGAETVIFKLIRTVEDIQSTEPDSVLDSAKPA